MVSVWKSINLKLLVMILLGFWSVSSVYAQNNRDYEEKTYDITIKDVNLLIANNTKIFLWGVEKIDTNAALFNLRARNILEEKVSGKTVTCTTQARKDDVISAQCINFSEEDLSLYLLQQGLVSADRTRIHGTVYEEPYLSAEAVAHKYGRGIWAGEGKGAASSKGDVQNKKFMLGAFILVAVFIMALIVLGIFVMRGFGRVVDVQTRSLELAKREQDIKRKEQRVIKSMLNSEIKDNRSKIEAYLLIYEEMLRDISNSGTQPMYQKTGEVIQKQPALSRVVFDGNIAKLDLFDGEVASHLVHYYARIKTNPDYIEIMPDMPLEDMKNLISDIVEQARKLADISFFLLEKFEGRTVLKKAAPVTPLMPTVPVDPVVFGEIDDQKEFPINSNGEVKVKLELDI